MRNTASSQNPPPTRGLPLDASQMTATQKPRSCVTCRARKVRCDKKTPCSHCARARIACVLPPLDKRPRWANKIEKSAAYVNASTEAGGSSGGGGGVNQMLARLNTLEDLLRRYESQGSPVAPNPSSQLHSESASLSRREQSQVQRPGRLVAGDESQSRYVGTSFWAKINDEISALRVDTRALAPEQHDSSDDDAAARAPPPTEEFHRRPNERSGFIFGMNHLPNNNSLASLHPLPSQIPFIFNTFHENANSQSQLVDMPTLEKMIRDLPGSDLSALSPVNEALLFSIYYATITSMDDDAVRISSCQPVPVLANIHL
ncbi:Putative Fungal specific transcription factor [[Torrubiella] hemipterigena]|uniref:Putative Fungal specific transcription factor n=1 Tax=[Torrubiella] hemipterigena TaxID=1531966 RepID=A0A0A1SWW5_9HYPO|nr:Putative Fungal specific transcription factor [[Torrubiella] hemipterigena]